jgi:hypothetical protein
VSKEEVQAEQPRKKKQRLVLTGLAWDGLTPWASSFETKDSLFFWVAERIALGFIVTNRIPTK